MENIEVSKLNEFLEGIHMGLHGFKNHSEKAVDTNIKEALKDVYTTYQGHENLISTHIEELGGNPHHELGVMGGVFQVVENLKELTLIDDKELINKAKSDIDVALKMSNKFLADNPTLSDESITLVRGIIKDNEALLHKLTIL